MQRSKARSSSGPCGWHNRGSGGECPSRTQSSAPTLAPRLPTLDRATLTFDLSGCVRYYLFPCVLLAVSSRSCSVTRSGLCFLRAPNRAYCRRPGSSTRLWRRSSANDRPSQLSRRLSPIRSVWTKVAMEEIEALLRGRSLRSGLRSGPVIRSCERSKR